MNDIRQWFREFWCRVSLGHLFVKYGEDDINNERMEWRMCAHCLKVVLTHKIA